MATSANRVSGTSAWVEIDNALRNGQVVVSLQYVGYWTRGGHYLAMIVLTDDGKYVVLDSNLINYKRIPPHGERGLKCVWKQLQSSGQRSLPRGEW